VTLATIADPATVLVVDDDPDIRQLIGLKLWHAGYSVVSADTGERALEAMRDSVPDLVVLDVMMPGTDGLEVCRRLREDPRTVDVPVIMMTAKAHSIFVLEGYEAGATSYMTKPFSPRELVAEVESLLTRAA
jgi:two-component system phosphate regulon response regulator PhoB